VHLPESDGESPSTTFIGVVPIAQAGQGDQTVIILGALERYDHDAKVHVSMRFSPGHHRTHPGRYQMLHPVLVMSVDDDLGTTYEAHQRGGGGSLYLMHTESWIRPGIPGDAQSVTITVEFIAWEDMSTGEVREQTPGPWRFEVDLSRQLDARWVARDG
jgi:hypothetical protein